MVGVPPFGMVGAATLTPEQADALLNEMWYINVHTVVNPSGELRGNILAPGAYDMQLRLVLRLLMCWLSERMLNSYKVLTFLSSGNTHPEDFFG